MTWCGVKTWANSITWPRKSFAPHFGHLDLWHAVVLFIMLFASHDANGSTKCITWPKSHVAPQFNYLETNAVVPMITLLASCYTDTSIIGITWPENLMKPCCLSWWKYVCTWKYFCLTEPLTTGLINTNKQDEKLMFVTCSLTDYRKSTLVCIVIGTNVQNYVVSSCKYMQICKNMCIYVHMYAKMHLNAFLCMCSTINT